MSDLKQREKSNTSADEASRSTKTYSTGGIDAALLQRKIARRAIQRKAELTEKNSQVPEDDRVPKKFKTLVAKGYTFYPVEDGGLDILNSAATDKPDATLPKQKVGQGGYDAVTNATFTTGDYVTSAGAVMRDGKLDTPGVAKAANRGGVAVLDDGSIEVGRASGNSAQAIEKSFGTQDHHVKDFVGGGALLVENGNPVSNDDLWHKQNFFANDDPERASTAGFNAQQMHKTFHTVVGICDGQAYVIVTGWRTGKEIQKDLLGVGFDTVVKFDGGSGCYDRDTRDPNRPQKGKAGRDSIGFGIHTEK